VSDGELLDGGSTHVGQVVRIGDTVRRPRTAAAEVSEAFLLHLERVGFDQAPRFRGIDGAGRQVLTFIAGDVTVEPMWLRDDEANRSHLTSVARLIRLLHVAGEGFVAPPASTPRRDCPAPGTTWLHGDVHYGNLVFRGDDPVALLDWDFVMPGDALYDVVTLLFSARNPRPELPDEHDDRAESARLTLAAVLDGYEADDAQRHRATTVAAAMFHGAADYLAELGAQGCGARTVAEFLAEVDRRRFLGDWWVKQSLP
jgi:hypothetical protein